MLEVRVTVCPQTLNPEPQTLNPKPNSRVFVCVCVCLYCLGFGVFWYKVLGGMIPPWSHLLDFETDIDPRFPLQHFRIRV